MGAETEIVAEVATQNAETLFNLIASLMIADLDDKSEVACLMAECADFAHSRGLAENERLLRLAELLGGVTITNAELQQKAKSEGALLLALYREQKSRGPVKPVTTPVEVVAEVHATTPTPNDATAAPPASNDASTTLPAAGVPAAEAPVTETAAADAPLGEAPVRRRQRSGGKGGKKTS